MLRKNKIVVCALLIITILISFVGCKKDNSIMVIDSLKSLFSNEANKFDFVSSHSIAIDKNYSASTDLSKVIIHILPENINVDFGVTMFYNPSELRINGYAAGTHETALLFKALDVGVDIDFDLYANINEGIFFKSDDGFKIIEDKYPEWNITKTKDNWIQVGSIADAKVIFSAFEKLRNSDNTEILLKDNITQVETSKENTKNIIKTELNLINIFNQLVDESGKQTKLYNNITEILSSINLIATYTVDNKVLTQTTYEPTTNTNSTELNKVVKSSSGIIYRFTYKTSTEESLKPDGEYK